MGLLDDEIEPGGEPLRPCPNCGEDKMYRTSEGILSSMEYFCDECGYESNKAEVQRSAREILSEPLKKNQGQTEQPSENDLKKLKLKPKLEPDEGILFVESYHLNAIRNNAMLAITTDNVYTRPKKGTQINNPTDSLSAEDVTRDIRMGDIEVVRTSLGAFTAEIEFETSDDIITIDGFQKKTVERAATAIVESAGLISSDYDTAEDQENQSAENTIRTGIAGTGAVLGIGGFVLGFLIILMGVLFSVTIIGAIVGIPIIIFGIMIIYGSAFSGAIGIEALGGIKSGESEWVKP